MATRESATLSKFLSFILRHKPEDIGIQLDAQGWADVDELLAKSAAAGTHFSLDDLLSVVETSEKRRFTLSPDNTRIRAAQGYSIAVELGLLPVQPPALLFHGTSADSVDVIFREGLRPLSRQQVHLSVDRDAARRVGRRHGKPVVLVVHATHMHDEGFHFFVADNGVWLTDHVPPDYLDSSSSAADSAIASKHPKLSK